ncbi:MAG: hydrogenase maturation nickel metallochaperone HypA [Treponema sp.]|jgi:hydrogenase nickel incorporation protein HypA/HybF|nr:hydrogenase maturation nickel metallochaperone HypA [Treponema sp.]
MHELGVVIEAVKTVERFAAENGVTKIDTIVLQIGELSSIIPRYVYAVYPAAVDGTPMQDTKLEIEILPGNALCRDCSRVFNVRENNGRCPVCGGKKMEVLGGRGFFIKEIIAC